MPSKDTVYQTLAERRLQQDTLVWEVPVLSFTAQAFLFTIALAPETSEFARILSASISMLIAALSLTLMKNHRIREITDAVWIEDIEKADTELPELYRIHDKAIWDRRMAATRLRLTRASPRSQRLDAWVPLVRGYITWIFGLGIFFLAGFTIIILAICAPKVFG